MATGSEDFFLSICLNAITASERNCSKISAKPLSKNAIGPLPVVVRRSNRRCLRWLNTVLRAVSVTHVTARVLQWTNNGTQKTISQNLLIKIL